MHILVKMIIVIYELLHVRDLKPTSNRQSDSGTKKLQSISCQENCQGSQALFNIGVIARNFNKPSRNCMKAFKGAAIHSGVYI